MVEPNLSLRPDPARVLEDLDIERVKLEVEDAKKQVEHEKEILQAQSEHEKEILQKKADDEKEILKKQIHSL